MAEKKAIIADKKEDFLNPNLDTRARYDNIVYFKHEGETGDKIRKIFEDLEKDNPEYNIVINDAQLDIMGIVIHYSKIKR